MLNDFLFSKLFGERGCQKETLHIINTFTEKNFKNLIYEQNELRGLHIGNKKSITDVLVTTNDGTLINIEAQIKKQKKFHKRIHLHNSRMSSIYVSVGDEHEKLPMTIMISILNFNLERQGDYHSTFILCEKTNKEYELKDITEIHYLELTKFRKQLKKGTIDLNNPKDRIMILFNENSPQNLVDKVIEMDKFASKIYEKTSNLLQDKDQYLAYIRAEKAEQDIKGMIRYGKEEEKIEITTKLKNKGIDLEIIGETTGLDISKIKKL